MTGLSLAEVFFLALGVAGFVRLGWCLVFLIADEEPMPAWLDKALDVAVGLVLAVTAAARRQGANTVPLLADVRTACRSFSRDVGLTLAALLILTIPTGSTR